MKSIITLAAKIFLGTGLLLAWGCSTTRHERTDAEWMDLFSPAAIADTASENLNYGPEHLQSDYATLQALTAELDSLANEMASLRRTFAFTDRPHLTERQNKQIAMQLFRFENARSSLWQLVEFYRNHVSSEPDTHVRGAVIGMNAGMNYMYYSSRFAALFYGEKKLIRQLDSAYPSYDIPSKTYSATVDSMTSIDNLELFKLSWYLFCKSRANPESPISRLHAADPIYAELIDEIDSLQAAARIQIGYIISSRISVLPDVYNRLHHSHIAKLADAIDEDIGSSIVRTRGFVYKNVARIKDPGTDVLEFSDEQVRQIKAALQPGDLLFTYTSGYMSNVFLPGIFKHGITYVGTPEERRQAGLTDAVLIQKAVSPEQGRRLIESVNTANSGDYEMNVVEAVSEGVILNSIEKLLDTHVNRLVVIRPRISEQERLAQLVLLFKYIDTPYDFKFDFQNDAYQCCTELIYRTLNRKGDIKLTLDKMRGLWILDADRIISYYLEQNPEAFDFILFADEAKGPEKLKASILTGDEGLEALYDLMGVKPPQA